MRRAVLILVLSGLLLAGLGVQAQQELPPPEGLTEGELPIGLQRTPEDIEAAASLMAGFTESSLRDAPPNGISHIVTPRTIRVGLTPREIYSSFLSCSDWVNAGMPVSEVIEIPFHEYVKNVLPNEWIHTWHPEALKAGAIAAKTFAWYKMTLRGTVWQRPNGADVVDNTCDQVFIRNSRRASTDTAVDATWHLRMSRNNRILPINYLDRLWRCESYNWPDCMGQWDSQTNALDGWTYDQILHFYYDPIDINETRDTPANVNVIRNGGFDQGTDNWTPWGSIAGYGIYDGALGFFRSASGFDPAVVYQDIDYQVYLDSVMEVAFTLANTSSATKTVNVHLHDVDGWTGAISCQFQIPPNMPALPYTMFGTTSTYWRAIRLELAVDSADGLAFQLFDDVSVRYLPNASPTFGCNEPKPLAPRITAPANGTLHPTNFRLTLQEGASTNLPGQQTLYWLQIATAPDFDYARVVFDNSGALNPATSYNVTLSPGEYFLRARQFDGDGRRSVWSPVNAISVRAYPTAPVAQLPQGWLEGDALAFVWQPGENVTQYVLIVQNADGIVLYKRAMPPEFFNCDAALCGITAQEMGLMPILQDEHEYRWRVQARNPYARANAPWITFTPNLPGTPVQLSPANGIPTDGDVLFTWQPLTLADRYVLFIENSSGLRVFKAKKAASELCSVDLCQMRVSDVGTPLPPGQYTWWIKAVRAAPRELSWSATWAFEVSAPLPPP
ncbi:MAG TPA: SpoIID/LytB domain-containing protein [Aggregatilineales bacterium]|nr:SpoIID/LytB domain-containing protein [Aggregatilineales bacterium]